MTVAEMIRELQAIPNQNVPVRVVLCSVYAQIFPGHFELQELTDEDAELADDVRYEGAFVLIRGR